MRVWLWAQGCEEPAGWLVGEPCDWVLTDSESERGKCWEKCACGSEWGTKEGLNMLSYLCLTQS